MSPLAHGGALAAALVLAGAVHAAPVAATLLAQVRVAHSDVAFADLAVLSGDAAGLSALAHLVVCRAPRVGYVQRLTPAMLYVAARRAGLDVDIQWSGAAAVQVSTVAQQIDGADINAAVLSALRALDPDRGLVFAMPHAPDALDVPAGRNSLRVRRLDADALLPRTVVWVDIMVDGALYRSVQVPVGVTREQPVLVARADLRAGTVLEESAFVLERRNVVGARAPMLSALPAGYPARLAHPLRAGDGLSADRLVAQNGVVSGDHVQVVAQAGAAAVEMDGVVVRGGVSGQVVEVQVAHSAQRLTGTLMGGRIVAVE